MSTLAEQPVIEFVEHQLRGPRMKGTVSVRFDRDHVGRRRIRFGGENYGDDEAEEVTVNGKQYRMCAAAIEESTGLWKWDRDYDVLRVPGTLKRGTDAARAAIRVEVQQVAAAYAEKHPGRFDETAAYQAGKSRENYLRVAEDAENQARLLRAQAELLEWIEEGAAVIRPWDGYRRGSRLRMEFGCHNTRVDMPEKASGRAEVVAHIVIDGEIVGYMGQTDHRGQVFVPSAHVLSLYDR